MSKLLFGLYRRLYGQTDGPVYLQVEGCTATENWLAEDEGASESCLFKCLSLAPEDNSYVDNRFSDPPLPGERTFTEVET